MITALRRQKLVDLCEFKDILVYKVSPRIARAVTEKPVSKTTKTANLKPGMVLYTCNLMNGKAEAKE